MSVKSEMELKLSNGRIVSAEVKDGVCKLVIEAEEEKVAEVTKKPEIFDPFILVEASKLSLDDEFMQYEPKKEREKEFKEFLTDVIKEGIPDFYRPKLDPSLDKKGKLSYIPGEKPAVVESFKWWSEAANEFCPECNSRLGTDSQYIAFLGVLMKKLVESGWSVEETWSAVSRNPHKLGHYRNSHDGRLGFEPTGSREICGFCDLANTYKILASDEENIDFWLAGGSYKDFSCDQPLYEIWHDGSWKITYPNFDAVGWIVLDP